MVNALLTLRERVEAWIWNDNLRAISPNRRFAVSAVRLIYVTLRELLGGELNLRAMSLVYTTLLSLVPLLAVSFSVLKGFGVHNQIEPLLMNFLDPLGDKGQDVGKQIIGFVENVKVGVLGGLGLSFLIFTVVSLIQKIESAFNFVWQVERLRSMSQRFSNYLSVILIGPVLMFTAIGITASFMNLSLVKELMEMEPFGQLFVMLTKLLPYLLICAAFTFIYIFIPNTQVKFTAALVGAILGGVLWQSTGWAFAAFIASSSNYAAIYSSFAILILLLIWMYLSWLILLIGAQVAFYVQHPQYLVKEAVRLVLSNRLKERLGLQILYLVTRNHAKNESPWSMEALIDELAIPGEPVHRVLRILVRAGFLAESNDEPPVYLPRRDTSTVTIAEVLETIRSAGEGQFLRDSDVNFSPAVVQTMQDVGAARTQSLAGRTLKDMVED